MRWLAVVLLLLLAHHRSSSALNLTVFHVNPASFGAAPINMNTGDALGDLFFTLRSASLALECAGPPPYYTNDCVNPEVESKNLAITKLVLDVVDDTFGAYAHCNVCANGTDNHGIVNCTDGEYVCACEFPSPAQPVVQPGAGCDGLVGREDIEMSFGGRQCDPGDPDYMCWRWATARKTGGAWYSTTAQGYNKTWRVAEVVKRVSKDCADASFHEAVEAADGSHGCFAGCNGGVETPCFLRCSQHQ